MDGLLGALSSNPAWAGGGVAAMLLVLTIIFGQMNKGAAALTQSTKDHMNRLEADAEAERVARRKIEAESAVWQARALAAESELAALGREAERRQQWDKDHAPQSGT